MEIFYPGFDLIMVLFAIRLLVAMTPQVHFALRSKDIVFTSDLCSMFLECSGPEVGLFNFLVVEQFLCRSFHGDAAVGEDVGPVGDFEGGVGVLFHQ